MLVPKAIRARAIGKRWGVVTITVMSNNELSTLSKALYALLTTYESKDSLYVWPLVKTLADHLTVSSRTIYRALKELQDHGVIIRDDGNSQLTKIIM